MQEADCFLCLFELGRYDLVYSANPTVRSEFSDSIIIKLPTHYASDSHHYIYGTFCWAGIETVCM